MCVMFGMVGSLANKCDSKKNTEGLTDSPLGSLKLLQKPSSNRWNGSIGDALQYRVYYLLKQAQHVIMECAANIQAPADATAEDRMWMSWNASQPGAMQELAKAFVQCLAYLKGAERIAKSPQSCRAVLDCARDLFGTQLLVEDLATMLESGYVTAVEARQIKSQVSATSGKV